MQASCPLLLRDLRPDDEHIVPRNEHASLVGLLVQLRRVGACSKADRHRGNSAGGQCSASDADDLKDQGTLVGLAAAAVSVLRRGRYQPRPTVGRAQSRCHNKR